MDRRWLSIAIITGIATAAVAADGVPLCAGHDMGGAGTTGTRQPNRHGREREPESEPTPRPPPKPAKAFTIEVTDKGFVPSRIEVKAKEWIEITLLRSTDKTCARRIIFELGEAETIQHDVPLNQPVTFRTRFERAGIVPFACQMNMITGSVVVQ